MSQSYYLPILFFIVSAPQGPDGWKQLAPGLETRVLTTIKKSIEGDSKIRIVRIDPYKWEMTFYGISQSAEPKAKTAREWSESNHLTAVINAGMFASDFVTHIGYVKTKGHILTDHINNYLSVIAFDPRNDGSVSPFKIFDLDDKGTDIKSILENYNSVVQNLRLIKKPGTNVWSQRDNKWSEAAIGEDREGRILFIFSRSPFTMHDFNDELLKSGIGIVAAQHLEGGPEAQLYLKIKDLEIDLSGSYETNFNENNTINTAWPIPNIIGIRPKVSHK
jgi:uncharacterized protein YigE (DUF2233 family)